MSEHQNTYNKLIVDTINKLGLNEFEKLFNDMTIDDFVYGQCGYCIGGNTGEFRRATQKELDEAIHHPDTIWSKEAFTPERIVNDWVIARTKPFYLKLNKNRFKMKTTKATNTTVYISRDNDDTIGVWTNKPKFNKELGAFEDETDDGGIIFEDMLKQGECIEVTVTRKKTVYDDSKTPEGNS